MNVLFISIDSLNRHFLKAYGQPIELDVQTPNIDAFSRRAAIFDRHYAGSLPCMPARREFLAGREEMLWRYWGPMEPFDRPLARVARFAGVTTQLISDHFHYWQFGSHGYYEDYHGWDFIRGNEFDAWKLHPRDFTANELAKIAIDEEQARGPEFRNRVAYLRNVAGFEREEDYFVPQVCVAASDWLERAREIDRWFLYIDCFEVHEPFYIPEPYRSLYSGEDHSDPRLHYWPVGGNIHEGRARLDERQLAYLRAQYAGKLTMVDRWLGRVFDQLDEQRLWDDTLVVVTTDHGHFLGEHGWMGKPNCAVYNVIANTPLFIWDPSGARNGKRVEALTQAVDLYATMLEALGVEAPASDSRSLMPLLRGATDSHREWALYGYWGRTTNITDGRHTLLKTPLPFTEWKRPLIYNYSTEFINIVNASEPPQVHPKAEAGHFIPYAGAPVWRYPLERPRPGRYPEHDVLYDVLADPSQETDLSQSQPEVGARLTAVMRDLLLARGAPDEQFERLRL
jgi:arylsulfatase A-like enzyme